VSDWADEAAAKIIFDLATRYPTDGFGRMPCAVIADALRSRITALEAELAAARAKVAKLREAGHALAQVADNASYDANIGIMDAAIAEMFRIHEETA
jgi:hypothetical protein